MSDEAIANEAIEEVAEESSEESLEEQAEESYSASEESPDTVEELEDAIEEAQEEGASAEEIASMIREFELKVNGKTINKKIDLSDEEAVKRELQKAYAGQQAMQKSAELEKIYAQEIERLKSDPFSVLEELGLDADELAELRIQQRIEEMKKSPEELAREQMQRELEEARQKLREQEDRAKEAEFAKLQEEAARALDDEISTALDAHTTLAASPYIVKKVADTMMWAMDNGFEDVTASDVLDTVEAEVKKEISSMMSQLPEEVMEAYLGQKNIDRLRQKRIKAVKETKNVSNLKKESAKPVEKKNEPAKKVNIDHWLRSR